MPYFEATQDGRLLARAGFPAVNVLTAHMIPTDRRHASFSMHGISVAGGRRINSTWPTFFLSIGDEVALTYLAEGEATVPAEVHEEPDLPFEETMRRLRAELQTIKESHPPQPTAKAYTHTRAPRIDRLEIRLPSGSVVSAELDGNDQLQAVLTLAGDTCTLEVDALTVLPDGSTSGRQWVREVLLPGHTVKWRRAA